MGNNYLYCYTRTKHIDYRHVFGLSHAMCPEEVQEIFTKRIRAILNQTDDSNLLTPVFVFFRERDYVLYGVICLNSVLSSEYCNEKTNGRVRGFMGIVSDTSYKSIDYLPLSIDFYKELYNRHIVPVWESYTFQYENDKIIDMSDFPISKRIEPSKKISCINIRKNCCRLFSNAWNGEILLSEALCINENISIALNIDDERQVTMSDYYPLMNAQMKYPISGSFEDIKVQYRCEECQNLVDELYVDGMCRECWDKLNKPEPKPHTYTCQKCGALVESLMDGLCEQCYRLRKRTIHPKLKCSKCGNETDILYTKFELCDECYAQYAKKQKLKKILFSAGTIIIIIFFWVVLRFIFLKPPTIIFKTGNDSTLFVNDSLKTDTVLKKELHSTDTLNNNKENRDNQLLIHNLNK